MDCLFCAIAKGEVPAKVIYEDEKTLAFLDIHPRAIGHTMVIPKSHAETTLDLAEESYGPLLQAMVAVENKLLKTLKPDGFTIGINQKKAAGQEIDHVHIHVIPRFLNDGGGSVQSAVSNTPKESLDEIIKKING